MKAARQIPSDEIRALLAAPHEVVTSAQVEHTLTSGYGQALALEAERVRLHRRLREAVSSPAQGGTVASTELARIGRRLDETERELADLRALLVSLRARLKQTRARLEAAV